MEENIVFIHAFIIAHRVDIHRLFCYILGMKKIEYTPSGICARKIFVELDDNDIVQSVEFVGGCDGNHKGIISLCKGMKAQDVVDRLKGIHCGPRDSSCPDQLARALETR